MKESQSSTVSLDESSLVDEPGQAIGGQDRIPEKSEGAVAGHPIGKGPHDWQPEQIEALHIA